MVILVYDVIFGVRMVFIPAPCARVRHTRSRARRYLAHIYHR